MPSNITEVIIWVTTIIGGQAALILAAAYLMRSIITHNLNKDQEKYKKELERDLINHNAQLKANTDLEIARFNSQIKLDEYKHQLRFSKIYDKQIDVLSKVYSLLWECCRLLSESTEQLDKGPDKYVEAQKNKVAKLKELIDFLTDNRLFMPISLDDEMRNAILLMDEYTRKQNALLQEFLDNDDFDPNTIKDNMIKLEIDLSKCLYKIESDYREIIHGEIK